MTEYKVKLDAFEGPLDLLLHLINRFEIDIYDIPMVEMTDQYVSYVHAMQVLHLDVASEYLVMAATLLAIKSRMLLPKQEPILEESFDYEEEIDPREELVARLVEYSKYKEAAGDFKSLEEERSLMFSKPPSDLSAYVDDVVPKLNLDVNVYDMIGAYQKMLRRKKLQSPLETTVSRQEISIEQRMSEIIRQLKSMPTRTNFNELFVTNDKGYFIVTFLALLELMKRNEIVVEQANNFADIFVDVRKEVVVDE